MANEVCTNLGLTGKNLSGKLLQIVEEHGSNASFVIGSLMWNASRSDTSICLLAIHYSSTHYQNMTKKLGFNLKKATEDKTAVVMELFDEKTSDLSDIGMQNEDNLKKLFFKAKEVLNSFSGKKCFIIDDLSDLICLGASAAQVIMFLQYCRTLQDIDKGLALIVCSHRLEEFIEHKLLSNFISHVADYRITVAGLKTGFSPKVTGSIEVVDNLEENYTTTVHKRIFHFKLTDRQVKVFAPGSVGIQS